MPLGHYECKLLRSLSHETNVTAYTCETWYELTWVQNNRHALTEFHSGSTQRFKQKSSSPLEEKV